MLASLYPDHGRPRPRPCVRSGPRLPGAGTGAAGAPRHGRCRAGSGGGGARSARAAADVAAGRGRQVGRARGGAGDGLRVRPLPRPPAPRGSRSPPTVRPSPSGWAGPHRAASWRCAWSPPRARTAPLPTPEEAVGHLWTSLEVRRAAVRRASLVWGTPEHAVRRLAALADEHGVDEIMVNTLTCDPAGPLVLLPAARRVLRGRPAARPGRRLRDRSRSTAWGTGTIPVPHAVLPGIKGRRATWAEARRPQPARPGRRSRADRLAAAAEAAHGRHLHEPEQQASRPAGTCRRTRRRPAAPRAHRRWRRPAGTAGRRWTRPARGKIRRRPRRVRPSAGCSARWRARKRRPPPPRRSAHAIGTIVAATNVYWNGTTPNPRSKWSSTGRLFRPVTIRMSERPDVTASSTTYRMAGLSTSGSISFGTALVAGRNRVPSPGGRDDGFHLGAGTGHAANLSTVRLPGRGVPGDAEPIQ